MDDRPVYWIRLQGRVEQATAETFTNLFSAVKFAQVFANWKGCSFEILRQDGSIAMEVEPEVDSLQTASP